jgi:hypothetical protein
MRLAVLLAEQAGNTLPLVVLYIGPDLIMPLTSALAAILGGLLMFWNRISGFVRAAWRFVVRSKSTPRD